MLYSSQCSDMRREGGGGVNRGVKILFGCLVKSEGFAILAGRGVAVHI